jgi:hypothetical protein
MATPSTLRGRWLLLARAAWVAAVVFTLVLFVAATPAFLTELRTPCEGATCRWYQLTPTLAQALREFGLSLDFYVAYNIALNAASVSIYCLIAAAIFWRKPDELIALFGAFTLVTMTLPLTDVFVPLRTSGSAWWWPATFMTHLTHEPSSAPGKRKLCNSLKAA